MAVTRDLLAPYAPRVAKTCQRPRRTVQRLAVSSSSAEMEEASNCAIASLHDSLLRGKKSQSIDLSMLQLLSENPGLADFVMDALVQESFQNFDSTSPASSTCSESSESVDSCGCGCEEESPCSSVDFMFLEESSVLRDRYRRDASKLGSGRAIEFLDLARRRLQRSDFTALFEMFCSFDDMEVTEEMETRMWDLVNLDSELTNSFQTLFPSLSRM